MGEHAADVAEQLEDPEPLPPLEHPTCARDELKNANRAKRWWLDELRCEPKSGQQEWDRPEFETKLEHEATLEVEEPHGEPRMGESL